MALFFSSWGFLSAYLACTVFAFGCLLVTQPWWVFVGLVAAEVLALAAFKAAQGEFKAGVNHTFVNSPSLDWILLIAYYILMSSVPIFQLRVRPSLGTVRTSQPLAIPTRPRMPPPPPPPFPNPPPSTLRSSDPAPSAG